MIRSLFFMILIMMVAGISLAEDVSPCSIDMLPIQIVRNTGHSDVTTLDEAKVSDFPPGFSTFVRGVTEHLEAKLVQEEFCLDRSVNREHSLIQCE